MAGNQGNSRIVWQGWQVAFLKRRWQEMTAQQLADRLGLRRTTVRMKLYSLGLKKMELERWTPQQEECLRRNYKTLGDTELAEIFNRRWKKQKGWTNKHIDKKRLQLGLKRTRAEVAYIRRRNIEKGRFAMCAAKAWETRGEKAAEKETLLWRQGDTVIAVNKVNGRWVHHAPWYYRKHIGPVPKGMVVRVKDGNVANITKDNLELVSRAENARLNRTQGPEYKREKIKSFIKYQITQNEKQIIRLKRSPVCTTGKAG